VPASREHETDEECDGSDAEHDRAISERRGKGSGAGRKAGKRKRGKAPLNRILDRIGGDIEYKCGRCGDTARERGWESHRK